MAMEKMSRMTASVTESGVSVRTDNSSNNAAKRRTTSTRRVWAGRFLFVSCLLCVALALGVSAHYFLSEAEKGQAETHFESIADRALDTSHEITARKRLGTISMASIASNAFPDADRWPFVTINGYEVITSNLIATSSGREMGFCPLVTPEQLQDFEGFAYKFYEEDRNPPFPNGTAQSSLFKGVWGKSDDAGTPDGRYHETDGSTSYGSPYKIFAPILHHNAGSFPALMLNLHFEETRGRTIDAMIECAQLRGTKGGDVECGAITDMLILTSQEVKPGPGAIIMEPIYPAHNLTVLSGLIASSIVWDEVLENVFAYEVSGIDCVLSTENQVYSYYVVDGHATFKGEGDLHDSEYDKYLREIVLTSDGFFSSTSATYTLRLYPSDEFFEIYTTSNPKVATIGAVCIIIFTSLLFFLYDFFVRQEFHEKKELLEAKRKFVRFVSHEVRTPLNSVCMGLALLEEEIGSALGMQSKGSPVLIKKKVDEDHATEWLSLATEIIHNAHSSVDVLNDLLNYDKVESGSLDLELTLVSIWSLIENTSIEFKLPATKKEIDFETVFGDSVCDAEEAVGGGSISNRLTSEIRQLKALGDNARIAQVIRNLVSNALKFTPAGGDVKVGVSWVKGTEEASSQKKKATKATGMMQNCEEVSYAPKGYMEVAVTDSGAGMSEAQLEKLFRDGVQFNVNELQAGQGSGLGLYIAKGIMEQHDGTLVASSGGLGKGTTFTMTLPLYHVPEALHINEAVHAHPASSKAPREPVCLRILIVDDSTTNRKLLARLLANRGHICDEAENGSIAVGMADEAMKSGKAYDSILLDYEMPVMNGPDACQEIRGLGCDDCFIVGVTGNVMEEDVALFKTKGANGVLPKPFKLSELDQLWIEYGVVGDAISERTHSDSTTSLSTSTKTGF